MGEGVGGAYIRQRPAATAAADPPELPPATLGDSSGVRGPEGLMTGPK